MNNQAASVLTAGAVTPAGSGVERLHAGLEAPATGTSVVVLDESSATVALTRPARGFEPSETIPRHELRRMGRSHQLAIVAADEAMSPIAASLPDPRRCAVVVGVGYGATDFVEQQMTALETRGARAVSPLAIPIAMPNSVAAHLSMRFGFRGPAMTVSAACASGASAIGEALWLLRNRRADFVLAGGVDSLLTIPTLTFFARSGAMSSSTADPDQASRPFDIDRDGFVMGEGAGFIGIVRAADTPIGVTRVGSILGFGSTSDAEHLVAPAESATEAANCMIGALEDADISRRDVSHINAHGTSTPVNDAFEARAIGRVFASTKPTITAPKGAIGHLIGAAGAVECIAALHTARTGRCPPIGGLENIDPDLDLDLVSDGGRDIGPGVGLSNSFAFGGHNASLVVAP